MKIYKTKWYLSERRLSPMRDRLIQGYHYQVLDLGPFRTETQAFAHMHRTAKVQDPTKPSQRLQERKPEFEGRRITTVSGRRILAYSRLYRLLEEGLDD